MANENLPSELEILKDIQSTLHKQEAILERMESRAQLQTIFFWLRIAGAVFVGMIAIIGALWYAKILAGVMAQIGS